jgi:hypothetical protein
MPTHPSSPGRRRRSKVWFCPTVLRHQYAPLGLRLAHVSGDDCLVSLVHARPPPTTGLITVPLTVMPYGMPAGARCTGVAVRPSQVPLQLSGTDSVLGPCLQLDLSHGERPLRPPECHLI